MEAIIAAGSRATKANKEVKDRINQIIWINFYQRDYRLIQVSKMVKVVGFIFLC